MPAWSEAIPTRAPPPRRRSRRRRDRAPPRLFESTGPRGTWSLMGHLGSRNGTVAVLRPHDAFYHTGRGCRIPLVAATFEDPAAAVYADLHLSSPIHQEVATSPSTQPPTADMHLCGRL